ncbi:hypothetical protein [Novosphingobium album (ex Liu et al. 2023)]|uniref:SAM-dependent methyltransferase n=1 Tax=Novosphingobium album (ex Liu et al. 2023) TaxID=3031130 RepID=A0ABT5WN95_9SPHN|nr:hypothetical protein [Novosphingobium album (ex Liu et al. 2023)]MDE8650727.1 hypothetical protein [Novosphingobium album (ex Liu et al. 2023)]
MMQDTIQTPAPAPPELAEARGFAAALLRRNGRADLAAMVLRGDGDDFPEVEAARAVTLGHAARLARLEEALRLYADPDFWEDSHGAGSLATHDAGEMARNVLAGRPPFYHRD